MKSIETEMGEPLANMEVYGTPKGQPRPRAFARGGRARVYDPGTAEGWKSAIAVAAAPFLPKKPHNCPVLVIATFMFQRPKSHYRTGKHAGELRPDAPEFHVSRPDIDNLEKATYDALTEIGFWRDDTQVVRHDIEKVYTDGPAGAHILIGSIRRKPCTE